MLSVAWNLTLNKQVRFEEGPVLMLKSANFLRWTFYKLVEYNIVQVAESYFVTPLSSFVWKFHGDVQSTAFQTKLVSFKVGPSLDLAVHLIFGSFINLDNCSRIKVTVIAK